MFFLVLQDQLEHGFLSKILMWKRYFFRIDPNCVVTLPFLLFLSTLIIYLCAALILHQLCMRLSYKERQLKLFLARIDVEIERESTTTVPTVWEKERKNLLRILRRSNHEVEKAVINWKEWVIWRHESKIDQITAADIQYETYAKLAYWRGMDKLNRPCLVITG
jgi:hypothetical protein